MNVKRMIIVAGGTLELDTLAEIEKDDILVGADRGALYLIQHGFRPHVALGDFDSVTAKEREKIRLACDTFITVDAIKKDVTDTEMALDWALEQQPTEIILMGALGTRLDHVLANVHLLLKPLQLGVPCRIIDANNEVQLVDRYAKITKRHFTYCSLVPLSFEVIGVTLEGFEYPLQKAHLTIAQSLGISNVITEQVGHVSIEQGLLLVIQSRD